MKRRILALVSVLALMAGCRTAAPETPVPTPPPPSAAPTSSPRAASSPVYREDAQYLLDLVEETHPAFSLDRVPEGYWAAKETLLAQCETENWRTEEFFWALMECLAALGDEHTTLYLPAAYQRSLPVAWAAVGDRLYLLDEAGAVTDREVSAIGGIPVETVFAAIDSHFPAENEASRDWVRGKYSRCLQILRFLGYTRAMGELTVTADGAEVPLKELPAPSEAAEGPAIVAHEMLGNVFYVDFRSCVFGPEIKETAAAMVQAREAGITRFILDVRWNHGGDSTACARLLEALGMAPPDYRVYRRYSPLSAQRRGTPERGEHWWEGAAAGQGNPEVELVVLTGPETFSSANMLAVWIQDGALGTLVGRSSRNAPSCYGDVLDVTLPHTGLQGQISYSYFQRPDGSADQSTLVPDIETAPGEDPLARTLELLGQ